MRSHRKLVIGIAVAIGVVIILLAVLPYLFRDRIAARVRAEIAKSVNADVRWSSVGIGLLRNFPNVTFRLNDLVVINQKPFAGDTLLAVDQFRVVLDLGSVLRNVTSGGPIVVREVNVAEPAARLLVLKDGTANWDIMREKPPAERADTSKPMAVSLRKLAVNGARIFFDNRQSDLSAAVAGLDVALDGDFTQDRFDLGTRVKADDVTVRFAGITYLDNVALGLDTDVGADMRAKRFTFDDDRLRLNNLTLAFGGSVALGDENTALDLTFSTPSTDFGDILSLVPVVYSKDFAKVRTSGRMSVSGKVKGDYGPRAFPALAVNAKVENGSFKYPDLALPARDIALDLAVDNPGGNVDNTVVKLDRFHVVIGQRPLDARLVLSTPVSDPEVQLSAKGAVDLADVRRTVKIENVKELAGLLAANFAVHTRKSWVDAGQYDRISASGTLAASHVAASGDALPHPIALDTAQLRFTPRRVELPTFVAKIGSSDVRANGSLENLIGFALHDDVLRGQATVASNKFDLNEWRSDKESEIIPVPANVDFNLDFSAKQVAYGKLDIANARGRVLVKDQRVTLDGFRMNMLGGGVLANGYYETTDLAKPTFAFDVDVDSVDIPTAFASLVTFQQLVPLAKYARGKFSSTLTLEGPLAQNMMPVFDVLTGKGQFTTAGVAIENFPPLDKLADAIHVEQLRDPMMRAIKAAFTIEKGRLFVKPFEVNIGNVAMTVSGSNGLDQSLDYDLALAVPTSLLGSSANQAISKLAANAGRAGIDLGDAAAVSIGVKVTGTVTDPNVRPSFTGTASSLKEGVQQAVQNQVETRVTEAKEKVDSAAIEARKRASAQAEQIINEAEQRAAQIRAAADTAAARVRSEADVKAKALVEKASNPALRIAAQAGADKLRREADDQANNIIREAGERADSLVADARRRAAAIAPPDSAVP
ncbi:MAG TPA: AsmA-like C-terminal region-containing protein [Gemmatimonadaceae bacterium]|nr:AsmA-like C-terminal region-containing protein [Gemmatimonadaceae bacterium]